MKSLKVGLTAIGLAALLLSTGCAGVGPKYEKPATSPAPPAYKETTAAAAATLGGTVPDGWLVAHPQDDVLKGKWWEIFNEPELNALEEQLNANNQAIAQAAESYTAARAIVRSTRANLYPTATTSPSVTYGNRASSSSSSNGTSTGSASTTTTTTTTPNSSSSSSTSALFEIPAEVSWQPDLFGKVRSSVRQQVASAQASAANLANVRLSEQVSLAQFYFQLRGQDAVARLFAETIDSDRKQLDITQTRFETGIASEQDVVQAEVTLREAEANATAVHITRAQYEHAIAVLVGQTAGAFSMPVRALDAQAPAIPVGLPSQLLERRPDIANAERAAAEANALIGVGKAAYYPNVTLTASAGIGATTLATLFSGPAGLWSLGASLTETLIDAGARRATVQQYEAQYRAAVANYRQTVLTAFREVEDELVSSRELIAQLTLQQQAADASARYRDLAQTRYETGVDTYLNVLTAQNTLLNNQQTLVTLRTNQMVTSVQLIAALGGGWDTSQLPTPQQVSSTR